MKRIIFFCALAAILTACENSDDFGIQVSSQTLYEFNDRFPGAKSVTWETRVVYKVAMFTYGGEKMTAWYNQDGTWCMTERRTQPENAPLQVTNSHMLNQGRNASQSVMYLDHITRDMIEDIYVLVSDESNGITEYYYSADGVAVKTLLLSERNNEDYRNEIVPQIPGKVYETVDAHYPGCRIMEVDVLFPGTLYVDIIDGLKLRTMQFHLTGSWQGTYWDVTEEYVRTQVPDVYEAYMELQYNDSCSVSAIQCEYTAARTCYWFYLDNNGNDTVVKIHEEGHLISVS